LGEALNSGVLKAASELGFFTDMLNLFFTARLAGTSRCGAPRLGDVNHNQRRRAMSLQTGLFSETGENPENKSIPTQALFHLQLECSRKGRTLSHATRKTDCPRREQL
jgi:hypothetical protein